MLKDAKMKYYWRLLITGRSVFEDPHVQCTFTSDNCPLVSVWPLATPIRPVFINSTENGSATLYTNDLKRKKKNT
jgi:hypothetical protein